MLYYSSPPLHLFHVSGDQECVNEREVVGIRRWLGGGGLWHGCKCVPSCEREAGDWGFSVFNSTVLYGTGQTVCRGEMEDK